MNKFMKEHNKKTYDEYKNYEKLMIDKFELYKDKSLYFVIKDYADENNLKVVLHIPHPSLEVPDSFWDDVDIEKEYFSGINLKTSDVLLLELTKYWDFEKVIAPYSRLYVDVEKYWDDDKEIMSKFGMGAIYTKDIYGNYLHKKIDNYLIEAKRYYDGHHKKLSKACDCEQDVLIIDLHSFNYEMSKYLNTSKTLPDICFGINNDDSAPYDLIDRIKWWGEVNKSFYYRTNNPFKGAILPNRRNGKNKIYSLMLELNKEYYL